MQTITAMYETHVAANQAINRLIDAGFDRDAISLAMSDATRSRYYDPEDPAEEGVAWGVGLGAIVGALVAVAAAPALYVTGPLAVVLSGAAVGAGGGGLLGALVSLGLPEERARVFTERIEAGGVLVAVKASDEASAKRAEHLLDSVPPESGERIIWRSRA